MITRRLAKLFPEEEDILERNILLSTIRLPRNLLYLTDNLPKPKYAITDSKSVGGNTLPRDPHLLPAIPGHHSPSLQLRLGRRLGRKLREKRKGQSTERTENNVEQLSARLKQYIKLKQHKNSLRNRNCNRNRHHEHDIDIDIGINIDANGNGNESGKAQEHSIASTEIRPDDLEVSAIHKELKRHNYSDITSRVSGLPKSPTALSKEEKEEKRKPRQIRTKHNASERSHIHDDNDIHKVNLMQNNKQQESETPEPPDIHDKSLGHSKEDKCGSHNRKHSAKNMKQQSTDNGNSDNENHKVKHNNDESHKRNEREYKDDSNPYAQDEYIRNIMQKKSALSKHLQKIASLQRRKVPLALLAPVLSAKYKLFHSPAPHRAVLHTEANVSPYHSRALQNSEQKVLEPPAVPKYSRNQVPALSPIKLRNPNTSLSPPRAVSRILGTGTTEHEEPAASSSSLLL